MSKELRVTKYNEALAAVIKRAGELGVYAIGRLEDSKSAAIVVNDGVLERIDTDHTIGLGVQVFTPGGHTGFASGDSLRPESCRKLVETAAKLARSAAKYGTVTNRAVFEIGSNGQQVIASEARSMDEVDYSEQVKALLEVNRQALTYGARLAVRSTFNVVDAQWRIVRSDCTDMSFDTPSASVKTRLAIGQGKASRIITNVSGVDDSVLLDELYQKRLALRTQRAARIGQDLVDAPLIKAGSYKLVIDYALAKGLVHETVGHASETYLLENSVLARQGKLRLGEQWAADIVTITDGPIAEDYAYQPISANGMPRQTVDIIKDGIFQAGLGDLFSAANVGIPVTGAERVEYYRNLPLPRMTNTRLIIKDPVTLDTPFEQVTPEELRTSLLQNGLLKEGEPALYLSGYKGGQADHTEGDFVFNCIAIYDLNQPGLPLYQPALFSGKMKPALHSILGGLGSLHLDAIGQCSKGRQTVPSSGGGPAFVVIDRNKHLTIGGRP
jgi:TldD protein